MKMFRICDDTFVNLDHAQVIRFAKAAEPAKSLLTFFFADLPGDDGPMESTFSLHGEKAVDAWHRLEASQADG